MFSSLSDFGKELVLLTADAVAFIFTLHWHRNNRRAEEALLRPVLVDSRAIEEWIQKAPPENCWAVVQGYVEPVGHAIHSMNDKQIKGVIQRITMREFVTARHASGFWHDGVRVLSDSYNTVPFGLRIGRSLVQVENPLTSKMLSLRTIKTEFTHKTPSLLDLVWGFLTGSQQRGVQKQEEMLLCGTKITGLGTLMIDKMLGNASGTVLQSQYLTELTVPELQKHVRSNLRLSSVLLIISGVAGIAIIAYTASKVYKKYKRKMEAMEQLKKKYEGPRKPAEDEPPCIICDNRREVILLPCGHICLCFDCGNKIKRTCPICRKHVDTITEYFFT